MSTSNEKVLALVESLGKQRFWGNLTLKFEDGRITHLRQEINLKPSELSGEPKYDCGTRNN